MKAFAPPYRHNFRPGLFWGLLFVVVILETNLWPGPGCVIDPLHQADPIVQVDSPPIHAQQGVLQADYVKGTSLPIALNSSTGISYADRLLIAHQLSQAHVSERRHLYLPTFSPFLLLAQQLSLIG